MPASTASGTGTTSLHPLAKDSPKSPPSVRWVPAMEVETLVARAVREHLKEAAPTDDRDLVTTHVVRVEVHPDRLVVELKPPQQGLAGDQGTATVHNDEAGNSSVSPGRRGPQNGGPRSSCRNPQRLGMFALSARRPAPSSSLRSPVAGDGSRKSLLGPSPGSSRSPRGKNAVSAKST